MAHLRVGCFILYPCCWTSEDKVWHLDMLWGTLRLKDLRQQYSKSFDVFLGFGFLWLFHWWNISVLFMSMPRPVEFVKSTKLIIPGKNVTERHCCVLSDGKIRPVVRFTGHLWGQTVHRHVCRCTFVSCGTWGKYWHCYVCPVSQQHKEEELPVCLLLNH